jgi:hypothetical protein
MEKNFDIVKLIEKNPITRLSNDYQNSLVNKIKNKFKDNEQQMFAASFFCYLKHDSKKDFVVNMDDIWKWIGFSRKGHAKTLLEKCFIEDIDYKILLPQLRKQDFDNKNKNSLTKKEEKNSEEHGGHNKEQILLTINTFKKFCLKAGTKKADEIHDYYIKLEEILHETINEQTEELKNQLLLKDKQLESKDKQLESKDKQLESKEEQHKNELKMKKHNTLVDFMKYKRCVYLGEIVKDKFYKIGSSEDVNNRGKRLNNVYDNLIFLEIFECDHFREVEENILRDPIVHKNLYREPIKNDGSVSFEVVKLTDKFTYDNLIEIVKKHIADDKKLFMSPEQILEKQRMDLEKRKIDKDLLLAILNNDKYVDDVKVVLK